MINSLNGVVREVNLQNLTVELSGIGFSVFVPNENLYSINQQVNLFIYFYWNSDNGPQFFGFNSKIAKEVFGLILSCSGLGPKIGLSILNQQSPEKFVKAILMQDIDVLSSVNGIGQKKAELMIMQLKNKISKLNFESKDIDDGSDFSKMNDVIQALASLNYSKQEINQTMSYIKKDKNLISYSFDQILRKSLSFLSKRT